MLTKNIVQNEREIMVGGSSWVEELRESEALRPNGAAVDYGTSFDAFFDRRITCLLYTSDAADE